MEKENKLVVPSSEQLEKELKRMAKRSHRGTILKNTIYSLIVVAAIVVLVVVLYMPVMRVYGTSMKPTLQEGDIVVTMKGLDVKQGDVVGVYWGSKLLMKRVIATEGQWVDIDDQGQVYVDGQKLDEPYVSEFVKGECTTEFPYQVPANCLFLLGDNRRNSTDSRTTTIGCINLENVAGKLLFRIWPLDGIKIFW